VLFHGVKVAAGACLNRVVADKHVRFEKGATVGHCKGALSNRLAPGCQAGGVTVLGRQVHILADVAVGANCQIAPETTVPERTVVPDGENLS
jgi:NDP-sugar pyrophosphorylase family protein